MKANTYVISNWTAETKRQDQVKAQQRQERYEKYKEFKESYCDMYSYLDFCYYAEVTGLKLTTIKRLARYYDEPDYFSTMQSHILETY